MIALKLNYSKVSKGKNWFTFKRNFITVDNAEWITFKNVFFHGFLQFTRQIQLLHYHIILCSSLQLNVGMIYDNNLMLHRLLVDILL